jgi:PAS domain S-box-containing protein
MPPALTPPNESERLAALRRYDILDTPAEADFDDFTRLASRICGTPVAGITLIDAARQWYKSSIGLEASETPRDISFCGHAILGSEVMEVPNALEDERFRDSPLVTGAPNVRFYAGAPLVTPDGLNIGALCVLDQAPHRLTPEQREMLTILSRQVVHLLELRLAGRRNKWLNENLEQLVAQRTEELAKDICERKRAEENNIRSLASLRATLDSTADGILTIGQDRQILSFNETFVKMWRIPSELLTCDNDDLAIQCVLDQLQTPENFLAKVLDLYDHPLDESFDVLHFKDGRVFERFSRPMLDGEHSLGRVWSFRDITERRKSEERITEQAAFLDKAQDAILNCDLEGKVTFWNKGAERMYGWTRDEALGRKIIEIISAAPERFERNMGVVLEKGELSDETEHVTKDRRKLTVEVRRTLIRDNDGQPKSVLAIITDITERKKIGIQFMRAQRMESLGTLAGGIAHDLNNSLAPILLVTGLLRMQYPNETKLIDAVEASTSRGADMVRQLLTFAKGVDGERLLVCPRRLLTEMSNIIQGTFPKNIELRTEYANNLNAILGDATQLHQVLLNLCVNARDAMPDGGTLTLEARNLEVDSTFASTVPDAKPGRYVVWRVADTGTGMPPEILDRIFEPFFSTKGPDKGTGLGLSTVIGIVKSHGGFVQIYSVPGQGSTFTIYLPADQSCEPGTSLPPVPAAAFRGQGETILVVDDEAAVRQAVGGVLASLDFKVILAASGKEAVVQAAEKRAELRAVITDLHMPGMDGLTLTRELKGMLPEVGIIVASGRMEERQRKQFRTQGVATLLDKPFTQKKLEEALQSLWGIVPSDGGKQAEITGHPGDDSLIPASAALS